MLGTFLLGGCFAIYDEVEATEHALASANRLASNRLASNRLASNRLASNRLASNQLSADLTSLGDLLETEEGRELLAYVVKCALPEELELRVLAEDGVTVSYSFPGLVGLAPEWEHRAATPAEQRWVSACLLAHVNAFGVSVPISLRGNHTALAVSKEEKKDFRVKEGAFFGNVFEDLDGDGLAELKLHGCQGRELPSASDSTYLADRVCTAADPDAPGSTQCGFVAVGDCFHDGGGSSWACEKSGGAKGAYQNCHTESRSNAGGWPAEGELYEEVITVYLLD